MSRSRYDAVIVGGGHNALTAAVYLAQAGRSVLLLERQGQVGGAAVSEQVFDGVDAWLSRYAYLVSLLPRQIVDELGLRFAVRRRRISSYTPAAGGGLLVDTGDDEATAASFAALTGSAAEFDAWRRFYGRVAHVARRIFPTMTEPLVSREELRRRVGDDAMWAALVDEPIGVVLRSTFGDDVVRGVVATDALIGTFAALDDPSLVQNRCFLYHVVGNGTGEWNVPVGGMGAVSAALHDAARRAGAEVRTHATVTAIDPAGAVSFLERRGARSEKRAEGPSATEQFADDDGRETTVGAGHVLAGCAPTTLARLLGEQVDERPEGSQLKVNMLLRRLPRLRDGMDPAIAFSGTFHVNESMTQLERAHAEAAAGGIPTLPPCEVYCHSLTDASILGPEPRAAGMHTLTLFGLHQPARLFRADPAGSRDAALRATLDSLNSVLAEPIEGCLALDAAGKPCLDVRSPLDLEDELGLPGGHIFHRDLAWPFAETAADVGRWGVETHHPRVLLCGAGARRGGGVSGIPGRAAALAVLGLDAGAGRTFFGQ